MPSPREHIEARRNTVALILNALLAEHPEDDRGAELLAAMSHLDLIPVVLILAEVAGRAAIEREGSRAAAIADARSQLLELAGRPA